MLQYTMKLLTLVYDWSKFLPFLNPKYLLLVVILISIIFLVISLFCFFLSYFYGHCLLWRRSSNVVLLSEWELK